MILEVKNDLRRNDVCAKFVLEVASIHAKHSSLRVRLDVSLLFKKLQERHVQILLCTRHTRMVQGGLAYRHAVQNDPVAIYLVVVCELVHKLLESHAWGVLDLDLVPRGVT